VVANDFSYPRPFGELWSRVFVELYAKILVQYGILNMEVHLSPEFEAELKRTASERLRG